MFRDQKHHQKGHNSNQQPPKTSSKGLHVVAEVVVLRQDPPIGQEHGMVDTIRATKAWSCHDNCDFGATLEVHIPWFRKVQRCFQSFFIFIKTLGSETFRHLLGSMTDQNAPPPPAQWSPSFLATDKQWPILASVSSSFGTSWMAPKSCSTWGSETCGWWPLLIRIVQRV